jgi:nicotinate phosphoribosyltransferase
MMKTKEERVAIAPEYDWMNPLLTDMYQITMSYAEWKAGRADDHAIFEAYFRKNPFKGKYTIFAGTDEVLRFLKEYRFTEEHIAFLKHTMPNLEDGYLEWLSKLDCSKVTVSGFRDG